MSGFDHSFTLSKLISTQHTDKAVAAEMKATDKSVIELKTNTKNHTLGEEPHVFTS